MVDGVGEGGASRPSLPVGAISIQMGLNCKYLLSTCWVPIPCKLLGMKGEIYKRARKRLPGKESPL